MRGARAALIRSKATAALVALLVFAPVAEAQLMVISGGRGGAASSPPPEEEGYGFDDALAGASCVVDPPTQPTITQGDVNVTPETIASHISASGGANDGKRIVLGSGSYTSGLTFAANDQEIVFQAGSVFSSNNTIDITGDRIKFTGTSARDVVLTGATMQFQIANSASDITIENIGTDTGNNTFRGDRLGFIGTDFNTVDYSGYFDSASHVIIANSRWQSNNTQATIRFMSTPNSLVRHSRTINANQNGWRVHADDADTDNSCLEDTDVVANPGLISADSDGNGVHEDLLTVNVNRNRFYCTHEDFCILGMDATPKCANPLNMADNIAYRVTAFFYPSPGGGCSNSISNNTSVAYQAPATWVFQ